MGGDVIAQASAWELHNNCDFSWQSKFQVLCFVWSLGVNSCIPGQLHNSLESPVTGQSPGMWAIKGGGAFWSPWPQKACLAKQKWCKYCTIQLKGQQKGSMCDILRIWGGAATNMGVACPKKGIRAPNMVQPLSTTSLDNWHDSAIIESV